MNAVHVSDLRKDFHRRNGRRLRRERVSALCDVSFTIERGECVAFLGQNGSGKSTLVRLLSTLLLAAALVVLAVASVSFVGIGMMTSVLPLISPEKGTQLGFVAQGVLLVVSGVYYPVSVLPGWMQWLATVSPATYALDGVRDAILEGDGLGALGDELWPLLAIGVVSIPLGLAVFRLGERHAKRHGKLKRSG